MKNLSIFFFLFLLIASCRKTDKNVCVDRSLISPDAACTEEYAPVCGCDGKTYGNVCIAKFGNGVKFFTEGACNCEYSNRGVVENFLGVDGCSKVIRLADESVLEIASLPANFSLVAGMSVEFDYVTADSAASSCMVGEMVHIKCIREKLSCEEIYEMTSTSQRYQDPISISEAKVKGDCIYIAYSYGGGCHNDHHIRLTRIHPWCGTPPLPPPFLSLEHNANNDYCEAFITGYASFDLASLKEAGRDSIEFILTDFNSNFHKKFTYSY